jgi:MFS family permease
MMNIPVNRPPVFVLVPVSMLCTLVAVVFGRLAYGLVLPAMRANLDLSYSQAANLGTVTALGYLALLLYAGIFAGRHGGRSAILMGLAVATTGFVGLSLFTTYWMLLLCMVLLGFGTAFTFTPLISLLGAWYPEKRGVVIGFSGSGVGIGMLLAGIVIPAYLDHFGDHAWRVVWAAFAAGGLVTFTLVALVLRNPPRLEAPVKIRAGLASVYRNPHVLRMALIYGIVGMTYIVQTLFMYSFALDAGVPAPVAGQLVALMGLISVFSGPGWGWAADRLGHARALTFCMLMALMATVLPVLHPTTPVFTVHFVLAGISVSGLFTSILAASTSTVKPQHAAMAVSFVTLFFATGQLIGPALAGLLIDWQQDFRLTFTLSALLMGIGAVLAKTSNK